MAILSVLVLAAFLLAASHGEKDSAYYPEGFSNPNVNEKMYWRDASNVLEDIAEFDALYVRYHGCAWSHYEGDATCNADGGDEEYWYLGLSECFRPNAAYSLYGVLKGDEDLGCKKTTFINSFYTLTGVEEFTAALASAGYGFDDEDNAITTQCNYEQKNDDGYNQNGEFVNNESMNKGSISYGLGCSNRNFVQRTYAGASCTGTPIATTDTLASFNQELHGAQCVRIYQANNEENADDAQEDGLDLLYYSKACDVRDSPRQCPDPHGKLALYSKRLNRHTGHAVHPWKERVKLASSIILLVAGILLLILAFAKQRRKRGESTSKKDKRRKRNANRPGLWLRTKQFFGRKNRRKNQSNAGNS